MEATLTASPNPVSVGGSSTFDTDAVGIDTGVNKIAPFVGEGYRSHTNTSISFVGTVGINEVFESTVPVNSMKAIGSYNQKVTLNHVGTDFFSAFGVWSGGGWYYVLDFNSVENGFKLVYLSTSGLVELFHPHTISSDDDYDVFFSIDGNIMNVSISKNELEIVSWSVDNFASLDNLSWIYRGISGGCDTELTNMYLEMITYQLEKETSPDVWEDVVGATTASHTIDPVELSAAGKYRTRVEDGL